VVARHRVYSVHRLGHHPNSDALLRQDHHWALPYLVERSLVWSTAISDLGIYGGSLPHRQSASGPSICLGSPGISAPLHPHPKHALIIAARDRSRRLRHLGFLAFLLLDERIYCLRQLEGNAARRSANSLDDDADRSDLPQVPGTIELDLAQADPVGKLYRLGLGRIVDTDQRGLQLRWAVLPQAYPVGIDS
jgi:transposase InsO family protein